MHFLKIIHKQDHFGNPSKFLKNIVKAFLKNSLSLATVPPKTISKVKNLIDVPHSPDSSHLRIILKSEIDTSMMQLLEIHGAINWWTNEKFPKLVALKTKADGNCLLHSISMSLTGKNDANLELRGKLRDFFTSDPIMETLKHRWVISLVTKARAGNFEIPTDQIDAEWSNIVEICTTIPSNDGTYRSLEAIHIYGLAQILQTTIVVFSGTMMLDLEGKPFAPIDIGGIYVPDLVASTQKKDPILIGYDCGHFTTLEVVAENITEPFHIPTINQSSIGMVTQFRSETNNLIIEEYLNITRMNNIDCICTNEGIKIKETKKRVKLIDISSRTLRKSCRATKKVTKNKKKLLNLKKINVFLF